MGGRARLTVAVALVLATAGVSTAVAARQERATDAQLRHKALAAVRLTPLPVEDTGIALDPARQNGTTFAVAVRNDGSSVVVRRASWRDGLSRQQDQLLTPGQTGMVLLPQPATCPAKRDSRRVDHVDLQVALAGGTRTVSLTLPDPSQPSRELNQRCGLFRARDSLSAVVSPVRVHPGAVTLDVGLDLIGPRTTQVLAVRATEGVTATVTERLPLTIPPRSAEADTQQIPHTFTVTLHRTSCDGPRSHQNGEDPGDQEYQQPPVFSALQITVQHPGDVEEKINLDMGPAPANALVAGCGLPLLSEVYN